VHADVETQPHPAGACRDAHPELILQRIEPRHPRAVFRIDLEFRGAAGAEAGVLVGSPATTGDAPDVAHLVSAGSSILPGTSLAGVLRNRARRIARLASGSAETAEAMVMDLFGHAPVPGRRKRDAGWTASRLRVGEARIVGGDRIRSSRIGVDRATQGVTPSALFEEEPQVGGSLAVDLELRDPRDWEVGLLLNLVKDLISGDLAVGGGASVGRGVCRGSARLERTGHADIDLWIGPDGGGASSPGASGELAELIQAFGSQGSGAEVAR
jgi:hypothetical protein